MKVTIRQTTPDERKLRWKTGDRDRIFRKWVLVYVDNPEVFCLSFGVLPQTADSKGEMLYWAERWCSNNGAELVMPEGWSKVRIPKEWR